MKTTCFLQVEPTFSNWGSEPQLREIRVIRVTQKRPRDPLGGCVVVKLTLDIGNQAFMPLTPAAEVTIPVESVDVIKVTSEPMEVVA